MVLYVMGWIVMLTVVLMMMTTVQNVSLSPPTQRLVSPGTAECPATLASLQEELGLQEASLLVQVRPAPLTTLYSAPCS